jgi:hypothetical protein
MFCPLCRLPMLRRLRALLPRMLASLSSRRSAAPRRRQPLVPAGADEPVTPAARLSLDPGVYPPAGCRVSRKPAGLAVQGRVGAEIERSEIQVISQ